MYYEPINIAIIIFVIFIKYLYVIITFLNINY